MAENVYDDVAREAAQDMRNDPDPAPVLPGDVKRRPCPRCGRQVRLTAWRCHCGVDLSDLVPEGTPDAED